jgi:pyruvate dehydrogenase E1 component alpha subunit
MSDPAKYRSREEVQKMRSERDPIDAARQKLIDTFKTPEEELKIIDREVKNEILEAAEFAINSEEPKLEELWTDIYASN